jgi:hypothetical protein
VISAGDPVSGIQASSHVQKPLQPEALLDAPPGPGVRAIRGVMLAAV